MSVETWLPTGDKRLARSQDAFWNSGCSLRLFPSPCGEVSVHYHTHKSGSRHAACGLGMKKALNVLPEEFLSSVLHIHMTADKNQHNGSSPYHDSTHTVKN